MVTELSQALHNIKREQVFLEVRERTHRMRLLLLPCLLNSITNLQ